MDYLQQKTEAALERAASLISDKKIVVEYKIKDVVESTTVEE